MSFQEYKDEQNEVASGFFMPDEDRIRLLQSILETESGKPVTLEDAEEVGIQLIALCECLARDRSIVPGGYDGQL